MKKLLSMVLAMLMLVSVLCAAPVSAADVEVTEVGATLTSDGTARLYFNMNAVSWWAAGTNGNGNFAYFFDNPTNTSAWSAHAEVYDAENNIYYVVVPEGTWSSVILTRNNTSTNPAWSNKWNQTGDITLSNTSNYISKFSESSTSVTWGTAINPVSDVSVTASATEINVGDTAILTTTLTSNTDINTLVDVAYYVESATANVTNDLFTATQAGEYTVTAVVMYEPNGYPALISTTTATTIISVTGSAVEPEEPANTYTVVGGIAPYYDDAGFLGIAWNPANYSNDLTYNEETGLWSITYTDVAKTGEVIDYQTTHYEFRIITNHAWGEPSYNDNGLYDSETNNSNIRLDIDEDGSTVTIYFNGEYCWAEVTAPTTPDPEPGASDDENPDTTEEYTIYYVDSGYFDQPYAYVWSGQGGMVDTAASWPGVPMELTNLVSPDGAPVYSATFDKEYENVIFHDAGGVETADLEFVTGAYLWWSNEQWYTSLEDIEIPVDADFITIYFQNNWMWSDVHCYFDGSEYADRVNWPGTPMDYFSNDGAYDIYSCEVPADAEIIVFNGIKNDGSGATDQTPDILDGFYDGICYYMKWDNGNNVDSEDICVILPDYDFGGGEDEEEDTTGTSLEGLTATLDGKIGLNLHYKISDDIMADESARLVVYRNEDPWFERPVTEYDYIDATTGYYVFTVEQAAKEMTDAVISKVITDDYNTFFNRTSIAGYLERMLSDPDTYAAEQDIAKALLNYGTAAQLYFDYNTDWLANSTEYMTEEDKLVTEADLSAYAPVIEGESKNIEYYGPSLVLKSETTLKLYFIIDDSIVPEDVYEIFYGGIGFTRSGDLWYTALYNIDALNLATAHEFTVDGISVSFSALSYAYLAQQNSNAKLVNLANALAAYYTAAYNYAN